MLREVVFLLPFLGHVVAEDGLAAWLRYAPISNADTYASGIPSTVVVLNTTKSSPVYTAGDELEQGIKGIFGKDVQLASHLMNNGSSVTVGTLSGYQQAGGSLSTTPDLSPDGYWLDTTDADNVLILGENERGALYVGALPIS